VVDYIEFSKDFHAPISTTDLNGNELTYIIECVTSNWISSQGRFVKDFEDGFASICKMPQGVACSNGTAALHLALLALGIGTGDEVIVPDLTFAATINAVLYTGATPVIVDVEEESWCINPALIKKSITPRTKVIIPVHLYGQPCDMTTIMDIAEQNDLYVIEDCAEAHGAKYKGQFVGSFGHISCFSFFSNKIITTGEGGMCLTKDPSWNKKMRILRDHGMNPDRKYWHDVVGYNYRMTNLQAAIGLAQIEKFVDILQRRDKVNQMYVRNLSGCKALIPQNNIQERRKVTWLVSYILNVDNSLAREDVIKRAKKKKIDIRPLLTNLSSMPLYKPYLRFSAVVSEKLSKNGISLPSLLTLSEEDYQHICDEIKKILN